MRINYRFIKDKGLTLPSVLAQCSIEQIETFLEFCSLHSFHNAQTLIHGNKTDFDVYYILEGCVRVAQLGENGKEISFAQLYAGESFGEMSAIDKRPRSACVIAETEGCALKIGGRDFITMISRLPEVNAQVLRRLVHIIREMDNRMLDLATLPSKKRIHLELLKIANNFQAENGIVRLSGLPKGEILASKVACAREVVSREISYLKRIGVIKKCDDYIELAVDRLADVP